MADVLCLGEMLVDWVSLTPGQDLDVAEHFTKAPGGAPANVAVGLVRQGVPCAFIGRFGKDKFGKWLRDTLERDGVDTASSVTDTNANTRMAYVVTESDGDRRLADFSRIACADAQLQFSDIKLSTLTAAVVLHFGSISLIEDPAKSATLQAIQHARESGLLISYDPNVRLALWDSADHCKKTVLDTLALADFVKINLDELEFLTGSRSISAAEKLRHDFSLPLLVITLDADGSQLITATANERASGFSVEVVEATGAGDGFVSAVIAGLLPHIKKSKNRRISLESLSTKVLIEILVRANAVGAMACLKAGAIPALPRTPEIDAFLANQTTPRSS